MVGGFVDDCETRDLFEEVESSQNRRLSLFVSGFLRTIFVKTFLSYSKPLIVLVITFLSIVFIIIFFYDWSFVTLSSRNTISRVETNLKETSNLRKRKSLSQNC